MNSYLDTEENKVTPESVKCEEKFIVIGRFINLKNPGIQPSYRLVKIKPTYPFTIYF